MLPTLLAATLAAIAAFPSGLVRPPAAMGHPVASSAAARRALDLDVTGRPFGLAGNSVSPPQEAGGYRLSEAKVRDGGNWSPEGGTSGLSQNLGGSLQGLTLRLRGKRLLDKFDLVGGGSGVGPPRYAARKHLMLSLSQSF
jgi:hypothetical protein